jgi:hypothetical protein
MDRDGTWALLAHDGPLGPPALHFYFLFAAPTCAFAILDWFFMLSNHFRFSGTQKFTAPFCWFGLTQPFVAAWLSRLLLGNGIFVAKKAKEIKETKKRAPVFGGCFRRRRRTKMTTSFFAL